MATLTVSAGRVARINSDFEDIFTGPAGEAITAGQYVRYNTTTGQIELGNGSSVGEARRGGLALKSAAIGERLSVMRKGIVDLGDALGGLTYDDDVYLSDTDGVLADAQGTVALIVGTVIPIWGHTTADKALRVDL